MTLPTATRARTHSFPTSVVLLLVLMPVTILAAFALRVQDLGLQSLWFDEAMSVVFGSKSPPEMLALLITEDIHPPLYLLLLHYWMVLAGDSEFSARFLSVLAGVPLVPLMYVTGKRLANLSALESPKVFSLTGFVGAVLAASSAFYVGYSQEARNYMLVTFMGLLSSYLLLRALRQTARGPWLLYSIATLGALYSNYTAFLLLIFQAVFVATVRASYPGVQRRWLFWMAVMAVAYAPWAGYAMAQMERINDYWPGTLIVGAAITSTLTQLVAGAGADSPTAAAPMLLGIGVLAIGALALIAAVSRRRRAEHSTFLLLYLVIPTAILFAIAYSRPKFDPRYLLVATPAFYLIIAWGLTALLRAAGSTLPFVARVALPVAGLLAIGGIVAASTVYGEPARVKADYRDLVAYVEAHAEPGDAVVLQMNAPHPYIYYAKKGIPWYPMERVDNFEDAITRLNKLAENHRRLWVILWQQEWEDPAGFVLHTLKTQATEVPLNATFTGLGLRLFDLSPNHPFTYYPIIQHPIDATVGGNLEFWGWNAPSEAVSAGQAFDLDIHWIPHAKIGTDLKIVLTLVDADHHIWAKTDEVMENPLYPPTKWKVGDLIHDRHKLAVPAGTPPGDYTIEMHLYDPVTLKELPIATTSQHTPIGTVLPLGKVTVKPGTGLSTPTVGTPQSTWEFGSASIDLLSSKVSQSSAVPGDQVEVTAQWQVPQLVGSDYSVRLALLDSAGKLLGEQKLPISAYPSSKWQAGEEVTSKYWFTLPVNLDKARYWVALAPVAPGAAPVSPLRFAELSAIDVVTPDANYELPSMQNTVGDVIGDRADLAGFDLSATKVKPGDTLHLTLVWKALDRFDRSYKVFTHVINDQNVFAGQRDAVPVGDTRPTTTWRRGEVLVDKYDIPIAPDAKPGSYRLTVGMYAQDGGARLQITNATGDSLGNSVSLATVEVAP